METKRLEAGEGARWYVRGWHLFMRSPLWWVVMFLAPMLAAFAIFWFLPRLGPLLLSLLGPVIGAGFYHAARTADEGGEPNLSMIFEGFRRKEATTPLLILGAMALAVTFAADLLTERLVGSALYGAKLGDEAMPVPHVGIGTVFELLFMLLVEIAIAAAFLYAVPLIWFKGAAPVDAIRESFRASLKNFVPLLVFGLIGGVLTMIAILPMMLGFLLLVPVMFLALYYSYQSLFHDTEKPAARL